VLAFIACYSMSNEDCFLPIIVVAIFVVVVVVCSGSIVVVM